MTTRAAHSAAMMPPAPVGALAFNNLAVNGAIDVSQWNLATEVTAGNGVESYILDCWKVFYSHGTAVMKSSQHVPTTLPAGFAKAMRLIATTGGDFGVSAADRALVYTRIEGYRTAHLAFGSADARKVTIGFWVWATIAGTMSLSLMNKTPDRSFVVDIEIAEAQTWEFKTVVIDGDVLVGATWGTTTDIGLSVFFCFGCGSTFRTTPNGWRAGIYYGTSATSNFFATNNNCVLVTGIIVLPDEVELTEEDACALRRPFDYELSLCQRYYCKSYLYSHGLGTVTAQGSRWGAALTATQIWGEFLFPQMMRVAPALSFWSNQGTASKWTVGTSGADTGPVTSGSDISDGKFLEVSVGGGGLSVGAHHIGHFAADARL